MMRVTEGMRYADILRSSARLQSAHADATREATTGVRVDRPSKDPAAAAELARLRASLSANAKHKDAINSVRGDVELAESTLAESGNILSRAREIAMTGSNGTFSADQRAVMAQEVRGLKDELIRLGNTKGTKGYIFAGSQTNQKAFDGSGGFLGDDVLQSADIGSGAPIQVGASGARAFTAAGGRNVLTDLDALALALGSNDVSGVSASLDALEASEKQIGQERSRVGLLVARLDTSTAVLDQLELDGNRRQEQVGAADPLESYAKMAELSGAIERNVAVARQIFELTGIPRF
jgi:flagellar hook-associated protein 3 FlgL